MIWSSYPNIRQDKQVVFTIFLFFYTELDFSERVCIVPPEQRKLLPQKLFCISIQSENIYIIQGDIMSRTPMHFGHYDYAGFSAFIMYSVCSFSIPLMIVTMGKDLNFPIDAGGMAAGGLLHVFRSTPMIVSLLICSFFAAKFGKRRSLGYCLALFGTGILCCAFTTQYWMLLPCLVFVGFGEGVCEGLLTPFIQDLHPDAPERYVNFSHSCWSIGIVVAVLLVGGLLTLGVNWRLVLGLAGCLTLLSSLAFLWKENPKRKYPESSRKPDIRQLWEQTKLIVKQKRFWLCSAAMFFGAGGEFGLTFWAPAYIELTFQTSVFVAGLGTGCIAVGMFLGRTGFGYLAKPENLLRINLGAALSTIPLTLLLVLLKPGIFPDWITFILLFILLFLCGIGIAPYWPTTQVYGVINLPDCDSTLLYVYYSMLGIPGCGFFSWFMGFIGDRFGLTGTLLVVPGCLLLFSAVTFYECWIRRKKEKTA